MPESASKEKQSDKQLNKSNYMMRGQNNMTQKALNYLDLYFDAIDENIDEVAGELKDAGIDPDQSQNRIMQMIKQKKADIKIERGKKLKARVEKIIKSKPEQSDSKVNEEIYAIAARKLGSLDQADIQSIKKDAELLEDIGKLLGDGNDETGKAGS